MLLVLEYIYLILYMFVDTLAPTCQSVSQ